MLKAVVTDISSVDENLRSMYTQKGDKFVLNVEPVDGFALENVVGLSRALNAERDNAATHKNALKAFEGLDPAAARAAIERVGQFEGLDPAEVKTKVAGYDRLSKIDPAAEADKIVTEKVTNAKNQLISGFNTEKTNLTNEIADLKGTLAKRDAQVKTLLKENQIKAELGKAEPLDDAREAVEMLVDRAINLVEVDGEYKLVVVDGQGRPRVHATKFGADYSPIPLTIADLMAELRDSKPGLFKAPETRGIGVGAASKEAGSGAVGHGSADNPWSKAGWNVTKQVAMTAKNPSLAARLKAEAA